jgi:hypothetical protein
MILAQVIAPILLDQNTRLQACDRPSRPKRGATEINIGALLSRPARPSLQGSLDSFVPDGFTSCGPPCKTPSSAFAAEISMEKMSRFRPPLLQAALLAAASLGGCYQPAAYPPPGAAVPPGPHPPSWPALPANAACTGDLARFQNVVWGDVTTGNLNQSVYELIEADLARAANSCAAGHDEEARGIVRSAKLKHGYRAYLER